jgi:hypothetical protein
MSRCLHHNFNLFLKLWKIFLIFIFHQIFNKRIIIVRKVVFVSTHCVKVIIKELNIRLLFYISLIFLLRLLTNSALREWYKWYFSFVTPRWYKLSLLLIVLFKYLFAFMMENWLLLFFNWLINVLRMNTCMLTLKTKLAK